MLYNNLLFFLGIFSWKFKSNNKFEYLIKKKRNKFRTGYTT